MTIQGSIGFSEDKPTVLSVKIHVIRVISGQILAFCISSASMTIQGSIGFNEDKRNRPISENQCDPCYQR
jgi:hypothetical protein